jgi:hypothetical protein
VITGFGGSIGHCVEPRHVRVNCLPLIIRARPQRCLMSRAVREADEDCASPWRRAEHRDLDLSRAAQLLNVRYACMRSRHATVA